MFIRVHLSTKEPAASWMLELFGEVGGDIHEYISLGLARLIEISVNRSIYKRKTIIDMKIRKNGYF